MRTTTEDTTPKEPGTASFPGHATINVQYSGFGDEVELLRKVFDDYGKILRVLEGDIRQACTEPLMKHSKKMKAGDTEELQQQHERPDDRRHLEREFRQQLERVTNALQIARVRRVENPVSTTVQPAPSSSA